MVGDGIDDGLMVGVPCRIEQTGARRHPAERCVAFAEHRLDRHVQVDVVAVAHGHSEHAR